MEFLKQGISLDNPRGRPLFLAPMSGFTNFEFREMCLDCGADITVSEFVHSRAILNAVEKIGEKLVYKKRAGTAYGVQIFGSDPSEVSDAACVVEEKYTPDFIDINFGCPAPDATCAGAGSALLKTPKKMCDIISAVSGSLKHTPTTAKMRTGWSRVEIIVPDVPKMLEEAGAKMLTLHGRTKSQGYEGDADWTLIEKTAETLSIPVIGNGSVEKLSSAYMRGSACAGFMAGRAALGAPWIFEMLRARERDEYFSAPSNAERAKLALKYARAVSAGGHAGVSAENIVRVKPQIMQFLKGGAGFRKVRAAMSKIRTLAEFENLLEESRSEI